MAGNFSHPDDVAVTAAALTGAPQAGHERPWPSLTLRHQWHVYEVDVVTPLPAGGGGAGGGGGATGKGVAPAGGGGKCEYETGGGGRGAEAGPGLGISGGTLPGVISLMSVTVMVVHRLDTNSAGAGHSSKPQPLTTEHACLEVLLLDVHCHGAVFVEKRARLKHDVFTGSQRSFEHISVTVNDEHARPVTRAELIHVHLAAVQDVAQTLDLFELIGERMRCEHKRMASHVKFLVRCHGKDDQFARTIS
jgi:hypothetical protein